MSGAAAKGYGEVVDGDGGGCEAMAEEAEAGRV